MSYNLRGLQALETPLRGPKRGLWEKLMIHTVQKFINNRKRKIRRPPFVIHSITITKLSIFFLACKLIATLKFPYKITFAPYTLHSGLSWKMYLLSRKIWIQQWVFKLEKNRQFWNPYLMYNSRSPPDFSFFSFSVDCDFSNGMYQEPPPSAPFGPSGGGFLLLAPP